MKAFVWERYGAPETLRMGDVETPVPSVGEVLVKVLAVSVNPADWRCLRGKPLFSRATLGLRRPKHRILGGDVAGQAERVGGGVSQFGPATRSMPVCWTTVSAPSPSTSRCRLTSWR